jgi:hypothetical protein
LYPVTETEKAITPTPMPHFPERKPMTHANATKAAIAKVPKIPTETSNCTAEFSRIIFP